MMRRSQCTYARLFASTKSTRSSRRCKSIRSSWQRKRCGSQRRWLKRSGSKTSRARSNDFAGARSSSSIEKFARERILSRVATGNPYSKQRTSVRSSKSASRIPIRHDPSLLCLIVRTACDLFSTSIRLTSSRAEERKPEMVARKRVPTTASLLARSPSAITPCTVA